MELNLSWTSAMSSSYSAQRVAALDAVGDGTGVSNHAPSCGGSVDFLVCGLDRKRVHPA